MELQKIKVILGWLDGTDIEEIEVCEGEDSLRIIRKVVPEVVPGVPIELPPHPHRPDDGHHIAPKQQPSAPWKAQGQSEEQFSGDSAKQYQVVQSPIVGTFYAAPASDAPPYVSDGDRVFKGDVLCIVEAMKTMNHIESPCDGIVRKVLLEDGMPVEFGQELVSIEKF